VKLSRRERKRLANETQRAQLRDAQLAGTEPAPPPAAAEPELEFDFEDEAAA
jgi:hypothetical protein